MATSKKNAFGNVVRSKAFKESGPVAKVQMICGALKNKTRGEVIAKCVEKGINEATARTQYQRWFSTHAH
jgi:hypothetical protein